METFTEQGHYCLVLELLGDQVLDVRRWGPWRQAPEVAMASTWTLQLIERRRKRSPVPNPDIISIHSLEAPQRQKLKNFGGMATSLSLAEVRQIAAHLCGALAFLHDLGLIHADIKPENVVRSNAEAFVGSCASLPLCSSPIKLVDFGNCLTANELEAYNGKHTSGGFDVQTVTYRAPEVAAGLLLCSAMDMWSLGCLLLECVSGKPLFTTLALAQERDDFSIVENAHLLVQIEGVVTNKTPLHIVCAPYRSAATNGENAEMADFRAKQVTSTSLQAHLDAAAPDSDHFHNFIYRLLDVNPATRATAREALFHPFLQAFFPFKTLFDPINDSQKTKEHKAVTGIARSVFIAGRKHEMKRSRSCESEIRGLQKIKSAAKEASARNVDLRHVLKIIPRDVSNRTSLSPRKNL